jgi:hypothetical protein
MHDACTAAFDLALMRKRYLDGDDMQIVARA